MPSLFDNTRNLSFYAVSPEKPAKQQRHCSNPHPERAPARNAYKAADAVNHRFLRHGFLLSPLVFMSSSSLAKSSTTLNHAH